MSTLAVLDPKQWYRSRGLALAAASTIIKLALEVCRIRSNRTLPALASRVSPPFTSTHTMYLSKLANDIDSYLNLAEYRAASHARDDSPAFYLMCCIEPI